MTKLPTLKLAPEAVSPPAAQLKHIDSIKAHNNYVRSLTTGGGQCKSLPGGVGQAPQYAAGSDQSISPNANTILQKTMNIIQKGTANAKNDNVVGWDSPNSQTGGYSATLIRKFLKSLRNKNKKRRKSLKRKTRKTRKTRRKRRKRRKSFKKRNYRR